MAKKPAATLGDMHSCPIKGHGTTPIVSGSGSLTVNGKSTACVGDTSGCGATITEGAPVMMANGQLVAFLGSKTSHGGTIISGDSALMVDTGMASVVGGLDTGIAEELLKELYKKDLHLLDSEGKVLKDCPYCIEDENGAIIVSGVTDSNGYMGELNSEAKAKTYTIRVGFDALAKIEGDI